MVVLGFDQSLTASGVVVLHDHRATYFETIKTEGMEGIERVRYIVNHLETLICKHNPDIFVMEDYARQTRSRSETPLKELGGCIKWMLDSKLYLKATPANIRNDQYTIMIQNVTQAKKWVLGHGSTQKDPRYLLTVQEKTGISFDDDNQADAWMHATMASMVHTSIKGTVQIDSLTKAQQEVLFSLVLKKSKKMSITKAMKLSGEEKMKLIAEYV